MANITTGKIPNARKTVKIITGITIYTRKMAVFTTGKSFNAGVIASRGFSLNLTDEKIYPRFWVRI
jgi:hypothetical protein